MSAEEVSFTMEQADGHATWPKVGIQPFQMNGNKRWAVLTGCMWFWAQPGPISTKQASTNKTISQALLQNHINR